VDDPETLEKIRFVGVTVLCQFRYNRSVRCKHGVTLNSNNNDAVARATRYWITQYCRVEVTKIPAALINQQAAVANV
jgi:hypothetical protein